MGKLIILGPYEKSAGERTALLPYALAGELYSEQHNHGFANAEHFAAHCIETVQSLERTEAWLYDTEHSRAVGVVVYCVALDMHHAGQFASEVVTRLSPKYNTLRNRALLAKARQQVLQLTGCDTYQFSRPQSDGSIVLVTRNLEV